MHTCKNCGAANPAGVDRCQRCRIPGDFGEVLQRTATIVTPHMVDCSNCAGSFPRHSAHCPTCRWPNSVGRDQASSAGSAASREQSRPEVVQPRGIQYRRVV